MTQWAGPAMEENISGIIKDTVRELFDMLGLGEAWVGMVLLSKVDSGV